MLWIGDADVLPVAGYRLDGDLVYATTTDGLPSITDRWPGSAEGSTQLIEDALGVASERQTSRLGRLLAPMSIRYIVLPRAAAPRPLGGLERPLPEDILDTLDDQLDLSEVPVNPSYTVYRNEAALSSRTALGLGADPGSGILVEPGDLDGATPILPDQRGPTRFEGPIEAGTTVLHSTAAADGWQLTVDGRRAARTKLFGWADGYQTETGGDGVLRYETSVLRYGVVGLQALFWAIAMIAVFRARRRVAAVPELRRPSEVSA